MEASAVPESLRWGAPRCLYSHVNPAEREEKREREREEGMEGRREGGGRGIPGDRE